MAAVHSWANGDCMHGLSTWPSSPHYRPTSGLYPRAMSHPFKPATSCRLSSLSLYRWTGGMRVGGQCKLVSGFVA